MKFKLDENLGLHGKEILRAAAADVFTEYMLWGFIATLGLALNCQSSRRVLAWLLGRCGNAA